MHAVRSRLVILALVVAAGAFAPVRAADEVMLPQLAPLRSVRQSFALAFNGRPLFVCQEEYESYNRGHIVCHELATVTLPEAGGLRLVAGDVNELILYDNTLYQRFNAETTWRAIPNPSFDPRATLNDFYTVAFSATLSLAGEAEVDGRAAVQYQYWSTDAELNQAKGGQVVFDLFISPERRVLKSQLGYRGAQSLGEGELAAVNVYRDFNAPIVVARPPAGSVQRGLAMGRTVWSRGFSPGLHRGQGACVLGPQAACR